MTQVTKPSDCYRHIVVAVDFSEHADPAISKAKSLAQSGGAAITLIHVIEVPVYPVLEDVAVMGMPGIWDEDIASQLQQQADRKLQQLASQHDLGDYEIINGVAKADIVKYAREHHADLIVMGSHGLSGIKRLIGSTTNAVINHAHCDVLAVRIEEK